MSAREIANLSAAMQNSLTSLQEQNYVALIILTAVGYDYFITIVNEIEYVWSNSWTWASTSFILVRYFALLNIGINTFLGSAFVPSPLKYHIIRMIDDSCEILTIVALWAYVFFLGAADLIVILCVWAMYERSKAILCTLLTLFTIEMIATITGTAYAAPKQVTPVQLFEFSFCLSQTDVSSIWEMVAFNLQIVFRAAACALAVVQCVRASLQTYRLTKQWQINRYMNLLVRRCLLHFMAILLVNLPMIVSDNGVVVTGWPLMLITIAAYLPTYTLTPRFIMSIRELYARDVQGRRGDGTTTGFGLSTLSARGGGVTTIRFEQNEGVEEMSMDQPGDWA